MFILFNKVNMTFKNSFKQYFTCSSDIKLETELI